MARGKRLPPATALAAGWLAGGALALAGAHLIAIAPLAAAGAAALAAAVWDRRAAVLVAAALGALWTTQDASRALARRLDPALAGRTLVVTGTVAEVPRREPGRIRFRVSGVTAPTGGVPRQIALSWYRPTPPFPRAGERWRFAVRLRRPRSLADPGVFDYARWALAHGIGATGYVYRGRARRLAPAGPGLTRLRARVARSVAAALPGDPYAGLVAGLAVGFRGQITQGQWQTLRATGTTHLLAISGLHLGLVAALVYFLVTALARRVAPLARRVPARMAGAGAAGLAALGYAALAGFSLPTQRALVMLALPLVALALRRRIGVADALAAAAVAVTLLAPLAVLTASFWLSFGAVAALIYGARAARDLVRAQVTVSLALVPLVAAFFGVISLVGPAANLVAIPVVGWLAVPAALGGSLATLVHPGWGAPLFRASAFVLAHLWPLLDHLARLPLASLTLGPAGWPALAAGVAGAACLLAPRGLGMRLAGAALLVPLFWPTLPARPAPGDYRVAVLDVGQGLAGVVTTAHHVLLVDTGPRWWGDNDAGREIILPYLRARGLGRPDAIVLSHTDSDHSGGLRSIEAAFPRVPVVSGAATADNPCRAGQYWDWDGVRFSILAPAAGASGTRNNRSCVLKVSGAGGAVLFPGDIEAAGEQRLLERAGPRVRAALLLAPHHGSATSSTPPFVASVHARFVAFATGFHNRYHFPRPQVVARYRATGAVLLDTAHDGALRFEVSAGRGFRLVDRYRRSHRRAWTDP